MFGAKELLDMMATETFESLTPAELARIELAQRQLRDGQCSTIDEILEEIPEVIRENGDVSEEP